MENGRVVFLAKVENYTQLDLLDAHAYSSEYDPVTNQANPLAHKTNAFCSEGIFLADGSLISVGGKAPLTSIDPTIGNGFTAIRYLTRSATDASLDSRDWNEPGNNLSTARWCASAQIMPDGTIFVASGSLNGLDPSVAANNNPTFKILDLQGIRDGQSVPMDILEHNQPYYMYPFMHLLSDSSLFVFVSKSTKLFNIASQNTTGTFPNLPSIQDNRKPDIIICGSGAYQDITSPTEPSCGRIRPLSANAAWEFESMPEGRVMVDGTLLPDGTVIWLNGCSLGAHGFGLGAEPAYEVLIYDPTAPLGSRFSVGPSTTIARMYHSVALLLLDGKIMIAGSNPVEQPILTPSAQNPYVTEFRVEIYTPPYLSSANANRRPTDILLASKSLYANGSTFSVYFTAPQGAINCSVVLYYGGFVTHSLHMGHRMAVLDTAGWAQGLEQQPLMVMMPPSRNVVPPGLYVVYVFVDGGAGYWAVCQRGLSFDR